MERRVYSLGEAVMYRPTIPGSKEAVQKADNYLSAYIANPDETYKDKDIAFFYHDEPKAFLINFSQNQALECFVEKDEEGKQMLQPTGGIAIMTESPIQDNQRMEFLEQLHEYFTQQLQQGIFVVNTNN